MSWKPGGRSRRLTSAPSRGPCRPGWGSLHGLCGSEVEAEPSHCLQDASSRNAADVLAVDDLQDGARVGAALDRELSDSVRVWAWATCCGLVHVHSKRCGDTRNGGLCWVRLFPCDEGALASSDHAPDVRRVRSWANNPERRRQLAEVFGSGAHRRFATRAPSRSSLAVRFNTRLHLLQHRWLQVDGSPTGVHLAEGRPWMPGDIKEDAHAEERFVFRPAGRQPADVRVEPSKPPLDATRLGESVERAVEVSGLHTGLEGLPHFEPSCPTTEDNGRC